MATSPTPAGVLPKVKQESSEPRLQTPPLPNSASIPPTHLSSLSPGSAPATEEQYPDYASLKTAFERERASAKEWRTTLERRFLELRTREGALADREASLDIATAQFQARMPLCLALRQQIDVLQQSHEGLQAALVHSNEEAQASTTALHEVLREQQGLQKAFHDVQTSAAAEIELRDKQLLEMEGQMDMVATTSAKAERGRNKQVNGLNEKLATAEESIQDLKNTIEAHVAEITVLKERLVTAESRSNPESRIKELRDTIKSLIESNTELEGVIESLKASKEHDLAVQQQALAMISRARALESGEVLEIQRHRRRRSSSPPSQRSRSRSRSLLSPSLKRRRYLSPPRHDAGGGPLFAPDDPEPISAQRTACNFYMAQFKIPFKSRPDHFLRGGCVERFHNIRRLLDTDAFSSRKTLCLPDRTVWCGQDHFHALVYAPTLEYSSSGPSRWRPHTHLSDLVNTEVNLFVSEKSAVYFAGIYRVKRLDGVPGYVPGSWLKEVAGDISWNAMYEAMNLRSALGDLYDDPVRRNSLIREAYPLADAHGWPSPRVDCFGLQFLQFDMEVQKTLRSKFVQRGNGARASGNERFI
ncbi:hypothetical protein MIND_00649700 [Mycena indigotica]|uniref:Uncharacterized protein n=1 Tax=Mycena indigotica TaxID=2126181 RepID=A0A8H6SRI2_9AGAR|nr:uncharacterized protein MIND_00649700 [Mycena indigotica]KAF7304176.1 hypothetical protein MIND_00649700 [Mycena indigotica]